jgi:hypothetical protein
MASIIVNGETVHPNVPKREEFVNLAKTLLPRIVHGQPLETTVAATLAEGLASGLDLDAVAPRSMLVALADLGVRKISVEPGAVRVLESEPTDVSRGDARAYGLAAIESGRALVAAIANFANRSILVNGQPVPAMPQPVEDLQRFLQLVQANRLVDEDLMFTACRALAGFMKAGKGPDDAEYRCAIQLACELGIADVVIDLEGGRLAIRDFNESNAAAAALLQTGNPDIVKKAREKVIAMRRKLAESKPGAAVPAGSVASPGRPAGEQKILIPSRIGVRRRR